jgi:uncharacterized membrane protein YecN with MAPEG domain
MNMPLPVTAVYASLLAILVVILALTVVRLRRALKIGMGDGGNRDLQKAIRAHGNAVETIPVFLILMAVYEANGGRAQMLHIAGALFLLSRVLHAGGLLSSSGASRGRAAGIVGTIGAILFLAISNLLRVIQAG